ncbi:hypothetical protein QTP88_000351 [Uroleucon formosanum]
MIRFVFKETTIKIHIYSLTELKHADKQEIIAEHHSNLLGGHRGVQYSVIRSQYEATVKVCEQMTERFGSVEISDTCEQFVQLFRRATLPYLYEIESINRNMQLTLGEHNKEKGRGTEHHLYSGKNENHASGTRSSNKETLTTPTETRGKSSISTEPDERIYTDNQQAGIQNEVVGAGISI